MGNKAAVDRLGNATGSKVVANAAGAGRTMGEHEGETAENVDVETSGGRTGSLLWHEGGMRQSVDPD